MLSENKDDVSTKSCLNSLYFPFVLYQILILGGIIIKKGKMSCSLMIKSKACIKAIGT